MATSPSPLPFSTDATYHHPFPFGFYPAYAPDPNFSPPPCGFGAPAPGFFPYAAAYAPPPGFFPAPPPGFFPGAATQPTTVPPASTRIPTSCFHPPIQNPPNWPPPATDLTPTTAPVRHSDRVPSFPLLSGRSGLTPQMLDAVPTPSNRERGSSHSHVSFTSSATTTPAPTSTPHADLSSSKAAFASSNCSSMGSSSPTSASVLTDCAPVAIKVPIPDWPPSAPIPIHGDLIHHHYPTTCSLSAASNFPVAPLRVLPDHDSSSPAHHTSLDHSPVREDPQPDAFWTTPNQKRRPSQSHASSKAASEVDTYLACDAAVHTVADERIRTSFSNGKFVQGQARLEQQQACDRTSFDAIQGQLAKLSSMLSQFAVSLGKQSTSADASKPEQSQHISIVPAPPAHVAPQVFAEMPTPRSVYENFSGHPNQSSIVEGANTNFSEQNLDGMPQSYGFHNFNRQSIVLSDGTEHSYYALPDTRPLEQAASETIFDVYDDESSVCSNESVHVFTGTPEQHTYEEIQQEGEQEPKCTSKPSEFTLSDNDDVYGATYIKFRHGRCIREISGLDFSPGCALGDEANKWNMLLTEEGREDWDPGILKTIMVVPPVVKWFSWEDVMPTHVPHVFVDVSIKCSERNSKTKLPSLPDFELCGKHWKRQHGNNPHRFMLTTEVRRKEWDPGILNQMDMMLVFSATGMEGPKNHLANQELRDNTSTKVAALTWHSSLPGTPFILILSSSTYTWDPGVLTMIGMMLDKYAMSHECQFIHLSAEFLVLSSTACMQYVPPSGMYSVLHAACFLLQRDAHLSQGNCLCSLYCNSVLNTEYCIERMQWDPGVEVSLHCWLVVLTAWSENDKPLSCTHIQGLAALQTQSVGNTASYVWNPGTMLLQYKFLYTEENTNCHKDIKCYGVALWLIHFQPP